MKKQSSIEWLEEQVVSKDWLSEKGKAIFQQAKEMHKKEIIEAWDLGEANCVHRIVQERTDCLRYGDEYYKNTYEKES